MTTYFLTHLEPLLTVLSRTYLIMSEVITITSILWALNLLSSLIKSTYSFGVVSGRFYRQHLHQPLKTLTIHLITFIIISSRLAIEFIEWTYDNRDEIKASINEYRNRLGQLFVLPDYTTSTIITS